MLNIMTGVVNNINIRQSITRSDYVH